MSGYQAGLLTSPCVHAPCPELHPSPSFHALLAGKKGNIMPDNAPGSSSEDTTPSSPGPCESPGARRRLGKCWLGVNSSISIAVVGKPAGHPAIFVASQAPPGPWALGGCAGSSGFGRIKAGREEGAVGEDGEKQERKCTPAHLTIPHMEGAGRGRE